MARDSFLQPFDKTDPFNYPLGDGATYSTSTESKWNNLAGATGAWQYGFAWGQDIDPLRNVYRYDGASWIVHAQLRVPDSATWKQQVWTGTAESPTTVKDNPLIVWADDKETLTWMTRVFRYSQYRSFGGTAIAGANDNDLVLVLKTGSEITYKPGLSAKGFAWKSLASSVAPSGAARTILGAGAVRLGEMDTSTGIQHAVAIMVSNDFYNYAGAGNGNHYVWPAAGTDTNAPATYEGNGNIFLGSRLALLTTLDLTTFAAAQAALGIETTQGWALARAAQDYGFYCVDSAGGFPDIAIKMERAIISQEFGGWGTQAFIDFREDQARIANAIRAITNNYASDGSAPAGNIPGGSTGTLRRALLEDFASSTPIPAAPTTFALGVPTTNSLTATWDASGVTGETGFDIQHRTVPGSYPGSPQITTIVADATSHVISGLSAGNHAARARSKNDSGQSAYSNEATGTVPAPPTVPAAPSGASGTEVDYRTIDWTWTDNSDNEDGFKIQVSKNGGAYAEVGTVGANVTTYRYVDATPGTGLNDYTVKVLAYNATGDGAASAASDIVTTPSPPYEAPSVGGPTILPSASLFPDAGSKVFPRAADVKFPS